MHVCVLYEAYHLKIPDVFCYNQVCGKVSVENNRVLDNMVLGFV